jgi:cell wall-associated NlpC family hydrolase
MTTTGMNVAEVRHLADQLRHGAEQLRSLVSAVDGRVTHSSWLGRDADEFKNEWWPGHRQRILEAAERVQGLGQSASSNASAQEQASTSLGAAAGRGLGAAASIGAAVGAALGAAASAGQPATVAQPTPAAPTGAVQTSVDWARRYLGTYEYDQECLGFVNHAWRAAGVNELGGYESADAYARAHAGQLQTASPPPAGAIVLWYGDSYNEWGHAELSLGDGTAISTSSADGKDVHISNIAARNREKHASYAGWITMP